MVPPDPQRRGTGGPVFVQPAFEPNPIAPAFIVGAASFGVEVFDDAMGRMMEGDAGVALNNLTIHNDQRESVFRAYVSPMLAVPISLWFRTPMFCASCSKAASP